MTKIYSLLCIVLILLNGCKAKKQDALSFVPNGYTVSETLFADLNKDGLEDSILIIKKDDSTNVVTNEYGELIDKNRRGIIILFKTKNTFNIAVKNYSCFSSAQEDGGVYFPPVLAVNINATDIIISYSHGRYGYWQYTFRYLNNNFSLIEYSSTSSNGPILTQDVLINFITKEKKIRQYNQDVLEDIETQSFTDTTEELTIKNLLKLSEITDFDTLDMTLY